MRIVSGCGKCPRMDTCAIIIDLSGDICGVFVSRNGDLEHAVPISWTVGLCLSFCIRGVTGCAAFFCAWKLIRMWTHNP